MMAGLGMSVGCQCCGDCSCRQHYLDLKQDWHDPIQFVQFRTPAGSLVDARVAVVFDVSDQTGFGLSDNGINRITGVLAGFKISQTLSIIQPISWPNQVGFFTNGDVVLPANAGEFDSLFNANVGGIATTNTLPIPGTQVDKYVFLLRATFQPSVSFDQEDFTLFVFRHYDGVSALIDWRKELVRESEGVFHTIRELPAIPVRIAMEMSFARGTAARRGQVPELELYTLSESDEEQSLFTYRLKSINAPGPVDQYEKFDRRNWDMLNEFLFQNSTLLYGYFALARSRSTLFNSQVPGFPNNVPAIPDVDLGQLEISQGTAGEVIHLQRIGYTANDSFNGSYNPESNRVGQSYELMTPDQFLLERDRVRLHPGIRNADEVRFGSHFLDHFFDFESAGPIYLRLRTIEGRPIGGLTIASQLGQRIDNINCPDFSPLNPRHELTTALTAKQMRFEGVDYSPRIFVTDHRGNNLSGTGISLRKLTYFTVPVVPQQLAYFGPPLDSRSQTTVKVELSWSGGEMHVTSALPEVPQRISGLFCEPYLEPIFRPREDSTIEAAPGTQKKIVISNFRHYVATDDDTDWQYVGQNEIPQFLTKPDESTVEAIASTLKNAEEPYDKFWFRRCGECYTIDADANLRRANCEDFVRFFPDVKLIAVLSSAFVVYSGSSTPSMQLASTIRAPNDSTPFTIVMNWMRQGGQAEISQAPQVVLEKVLPSFNYLDPPDLTLTAADITKPNQSLTPIGISFVEALAVTIDTPPGANQTSRRLNFSASYRNVPIDSLEIDLGRIEA